MKTLSALIHKLAVWLEFSAFYVKEVVASNVRVAYDVLTPTHHMTPALLILPTGGLTDRQILLLANLITMTPGTLTLEVRQDRSALLIHGMYAQDPEWWVRELQDEFVERVRRVC